MKQHNAVDFAAPMRAPVVATADGVVVYKSAKGATVVSSRSTMAAGLRPGTRTSMPLA